MVVVVVVEVGVRSVWIQDGIPVRKRNRYRSTIGVRKQTSTSNSAVFVF